MAANGTGSNGLAPNSVTVDDLELNSSMQDKEPPDLSSTAPIGRNTSYSGQNTDPDGLHNQQLHVGAFPESFVR